MCLGGQDNNCSLRPANLLLAHPEDLSLAQLAQKLLGDKATFRDTRRLSTMMMREEVRETVNRAGRGQPITLTDAGKREYSHRRRRGCSENA